MTTTNSPESHAPVVLVVEDEHDIAELYRHMIGSDYDVRVANDGEAALEKLDDDVDIVLLDRMMPGLSGEEVLASIREQGFDCRVAMVTAVEPDLDIVEMGFDAYIQKPPTRAKIHETLTDLLERSTYSADLQAYCAAMAKKSALQAKQSADVVESPEFVELESEIASLKASLDETADLSDDTTFLSVLRTIEGEAPESA